MHTIDYMYLTSCIKCININLDGKEKDDKKRGGDETEKGNILCSCCLLLCGSMEMVDVASCTLFPLTSSDDASVVVVLLLTDLLWLPWLPEKLALSMDLLYLFHALWILSEQEKISLSINYRC